MQHALTLLNRTVPDQKELESYIGGPLQRGFAELLGTDEPAEVERAMELYRQRYRGIGIYENEVYDGIPSVLDALTSDGWRLLVVTAKPTPFAKVVVDHFQLADHFAQIFGSELDGRFAEKDDLIRHILETEHIDPQNALMIGDRKHDVLAAQRNGVATIAVCWGYAKPEELSNCNPDLIVETVRELPAAIAELGSGCPAI